MGLPLAFRRRVGHDLAAAYGWYEDRRVGLGEELIRALTDPLNPTSLISQTDTLVVNGRTITRSYNAATRTYTDTTPAGRVSRTVLDIAGRVTEFNAKR
ncbi:MAG: hypothetical protein HY699_10245 [Deltaproteobacteria bacterium]|nr:hypothetical protein [Deltaproteobacteria bacterium]